MNEALGRAESTFQEDASDGPRYNSSILCIETLVMGSFVSYA